MTFILRRTALRRYHTLIFAIAFSFISHILPLFYAESRISPPLSSGTPGSRNMPFVYIRRESFYYRHILKRTASAPPGLPRQARKQFDALPFTAL